LFTLLQAERQRECAYPRQTSSMVTVTVPITNGD